jgi:hypothetical protein
VDVALSKYCDLIPVERYVQMAARGGVNGLPANTLIEGTHNLSTFLNPVYEKIKTDPKGNRKKLIMKRNQNSQRKAKIFKNRNWSSGQANYSRGMALFGDNE